MALQENGLNLYSVAIVSCDIVGHSSVREASLQRDRVLAINRIVAESIKAGPQEGVIWASGGDGGHVVFRHDGWQRPAIQLIREFRLWSLKQNVSLRITAHYGRVSHISGADGRVQIVGDGINYSGWLLTRATALGVVVSEDFRRALGYDSDLKDIDLEGIKIQFRHRRTLRHNRHSAQRLSLMSVVDSGDPDPDDYSAWEPPVEEEHDQLNRALDAKRGWDVLYFAKRILQVNTSDDHAKRALNGLESHTLHYRETERHLTPNPFFRYLDPDSLREVVQAGQLVERRYNDIICRFGDAGDTMFVILRGQVGVYRSEGRESDTPTDPAFIHQEGEIVGELAFALARNRTADLVALTDVALLSFNYSHVTSVLSASPAGRQTLQQISNFIDYRVLEHIAHQANYLLGSGREGPLAVGRSWQDTLRELRPYCRLMPVVANRLYFELADLFGNMEAAIEPGLYILVAGELSSGLQHPQAEEPNRLSGEQFPVLWVDLPDLLVLPRERYSTESPSLKVFHVQAEGIARLQPAKRQALQRALTDLLEPQEAVLSPVSGYEFEVFLCHASRDADRVAEVARLLRESGIRYWLDTEQIVFGDPIVQKIEDGLRKSRFVVPCISEHFTRSNWARAEYAAILYREITQGTARLIIPLLLDDRAVEIPDFLAGRKSVSFVDKDGFSAFVNRLREP